jgi:translocation and assembly module TamA
MRRFAVTLAASAALLSFPLAVPAAAQDRSAEPSLEDLIPDTAVENPEGWAGQGVSAVEPGQPPAQVPTQVDPQPDLQADSPLAEMPQVTIPWPAEAELPQLAPLEPDSSIQFVDLNDTGARRQRPAGAEARISKELVLAFPSDPAAFPEREAFISRFRQLSTIEELDDAGNVGRLVAQANEDEALLERLLRIYGYYDALVLRSVGGGADGDASANTSANTGANSGAGNGAEPAAKTNGSAPRQASVRFDIEPGQQYHFGAIDLGDLTAVTATAPGDYDTLRAAFGPDKGEPLLADDVVKGRYDLDLALGEHGYPFAKIGDPSLLVDHARREGDLTMPVTPGGKYNFGRITSNVPGFMSAHHLQDIARFGPGDLYQRTLEMDLRRAILATGLVASAQVTPVEVAPPSPGQPGTVDIAVEMAAAKLRTIAGSIGYGTGEGFKVQGSWEHRNLFPPEGALRVRGIAGTQEQLLGVTLTKNNFHGRDRILTLDAYASTIDYQSYDARTLSLIGRFERVSTLLFQKPFTYGAGLELVATQEKERKAGAVVGPRKTFFIAAVPLQAQVDTSDNLLDPKRGFRVGAHLSPEVSRADGSTATYLKVQFDLSAYRPVTDSVVLAARARVGSIMGAELTQIAPSRRFYAGGGGSVRGYGYKAIGERNTLGEPNGGRSLVELSAEARIDTGLLDGALSVVPFVDAGIVNQSTTPSFDEIRVGAGIGVRYNTSFGPLRVDLGVPLNPGPDDAKFGVYIGLGQSF